MERENEERRDSPGPAAKESTNADKIRTEAKNRTLRVWAKNTKFGLRSFKCSFLPFRSVVPNCGSLNQVAVVCD